MKTLATLAVACSLLATAASAADEAPHRLGDHPAVVVQRLQRHAGYDYASKFYPHPAWLRLRAGPETEDTALAHAPAPAASDCARPPG